ncbi:hypothetical protein Ccrd_024668 [Cynara cardunculus var. scolymus]|uniref:Secreted protein n=1 Tax=Cynara cardunculus var. scolymus TaxID=59895 RepID=A0A103XDV8_CYNCS|nr:hypothetical protein Ccrd_024668 [Cynara cardunculus var. scolymus]
MKTKTSLLDLLTRLIALLLVCLLVHDTLHGHFTVPGCSCDCNCDTTRQNANWQQGTIYTESNKWSKRMKPSSLPLMWSSAVIPKPLEQSA